MECLLYTHHFGRFNAMACRGDLEDENGLSRGYMLVVRVDGGIFLGILDRGRAALRLPDVSGLLISHLCVPGPHPSYAVSSRIVRCCSAAAQICTKRGQRYKMVLLTKRHCSAASAERPRESFSTLYHSAARSL